MNSNSSNYIKKKLKRASKSRSNRPNTQSEENSVFGKLLKSSVYGSVIGLAVGVLVLFVAAITAFRANDPLKMVMPLSLIALYSAAFCSGFFSSKKNDGKLILCGLLSTVLLFCALFIVSRFLPSGLRTANNSYIWLIRLCIPVMGIIGATIGAFTPKRQTKPKLKRRS